MKKLYKNISILLVLSSSQFLFQSAAKADECHDKFPKPWQEPDRQRCRAEERIREQGRYETNKFDLKAQVEGGGWTTSWSDDISETDAAQGVVAAGVSIYTANSGPFIIWVEQLVQRTVNSISADLTGNALQEAEKLARQIIYDAVSGKSAKEITKQFDTVDFKAGAIKYSGRNLIGNQTVSTTWGLKPYVAFRVTSSSQPTADEQDTSSDGRHVAWSNNLGDRITSHREMPEGSFLQSGDGRWKMVVQGDGNLVVYQSEGNIPIWASNTGGQGAYPFKLAVQSDGNVVIYGTDRPTWATNTNGVGTGPYTLVMQDDANLVLYDQNGPIWATDTCCR